MDASRASATGCGLSTAGVGVLDVEVGGTRRVVVIGRRSVHHHHQTDQYADGGNKYRPSRATPRRLHRAPGASGTASARAQDRGHPRPLSAPGAAPHFAAAHARPRGRQGNATGHGRRTHCTGTCRAALERPARACIDFFFLCCLFYHVKPGSWPGGRAGQGANALVILQESEDFDDTGDDTECEEVDNEIHAAAVGEGEYGGIYDGDEDDVISALLALAEA